MTIVNDYLDMLEAIEQGHNDNYMWVNKYFIKSIRDQIESGRELTEKQKQSLINVYEKGKNK